MTNRPVKPMDRKIIQAKLANIYENEDGRNTLSGDE